MFNIIIIFIILNFHSIDCKLICDINGKNVTIPSHPQLLDTFARSKNITFNRKHDYKHTHKVIEESKACLNDCFDSPSIGQSYLSCFGQCLWRCRRPFCKPLNANHMQCIIDGKKLIIPDLNGLITIYLKRKSIVYHKFIANKASRLHDKYTDCLAKYSSKLHHHYLCHVTAVTDFMCYTRKPYNIDNFVNNSVD